MVPSFGAKDTEETFCFFFTGAKGARRQWPKAPEQGAQPPKSRREQEALDPTWKLQVHGLDGAAVALEQGGDANVPRFSFSLLFRGPNSNFGTVSVQMRQEFANIAFWT